MAQLTKFLHGGGREFFDLFERAGTNIVDAAALLDQMLEHFPERSELAQDILACEQRGDAIVHHILAHEALDERDIKAAGELLASAAEAPDRLGRTIEKRGQPLDPLLEKLLPVH